MNLLQDSLFQELWNDIRRDSSFPEVRPLLAHYTSIDTFEKIIINQELWLSNPLYMNDWEELQFGMLEGMAEFRRNLELKEACKDELTYTKLLSYFDHFFQEFDKHVLNTYILCFSEYNSGNTDGLLSMWRGYGADGKGVAIVFGTHKVQPQQDSPFILGKVHYGSRDQRLSWINQKISKLASLIKDHQLTDQDLVFIASSWLERLKMFSLFTKHEGFKEENEWRVVYMSERNKEESFKEMLGYSITKRGVEPKLKLKLQTLSNVTKQDLSLENIVEKILLGPSISSILASNSVRRMLELKDKIELVEKVVPSTIPYRS